ncbi:MAG TPA: sulfite exporter TauE/SafE family protein [Gaiellaceae bacterium]|nr:sulfite exporter TauE/SafE family protein [Gaiellaceae bacterium]
MSGPTLYVVLVAFGVVVGVASGLLGVGGGTLVVPFLTLAVGLTQHQAEATSLLVILPTAIAGSLALRRRGVGDLGLALRFGVVGAVGSVLGALLALALPGSTLRLVFAIFVGLVGLRLARDGLRGEEGAEA